MNPTEILKEAQSAGLTLSVAGGKLFIRGVGDRQAQLVEGIRVNKRAIITLIQGEAAKDANIASEGVHEERMIWPTDLHWPEVMPSFTSNESHALVDQIVRRGEPAIRWCLQRSNGYFEKFPHSTFEDQEAAAALDFLRSQDADYQQA